MKNAIHKLEAMVGRSWMFNNEPQKINSYEIKGERIHIFTDVEVHSVLFSDLKPYLNQFLPISNENSISLSPKHLTPAIINNGVVTELKNILMDNIENIKKNKDYIPQAVAINSNVNSIIELAKTEMLMIKSMNNG